MRLILRSIDWLSATLTRKFVLLLAAFLCLQAIQLGIGIYGILHIGKGAAFLNDAGRQRMNTLLMLNDVREAVSTGTWRESERRLLLEQIAEQDRVLATLTREIFRGQPEPPVLREARTHWEEILKPLFLEFAARPARQSMADLEAEARAHLVHLDTLVGLVARRAHSNALVLALFQGTILAVTLLLGLVGLGMAHYVVTRPLHRLIEVARAIAAGDYGRRIPVESRDEVGELARTFNEMAEAIARKTTGIEALNEVAIGLSTSRDLQKVTALILSEAQRLGDVRAVALMLEETAGLDERLQRGLTPPQAERLTRLAERVRRENRSIEETVAGETCLCLALVSRAGSREGPRPQGVLCLLLPASAAVSRDEKLYRTFAALAAEAIANARVHARSRDEASSDPLTGLANRRALDERLQQEWHRAQRSGQPFSVLFLDIDHFKRINDRYGHAVGDAVLVRLAGILREEIRGFDLAARYGGEEFVVLLPATEGEAARAVAERIRRAIARTPFLLPDGQEIALTVSIGIASYSDSVPDVTTLLLHADQALYTAKVAGRNRVVLYRDMLKSELERHPERLVEMLKENLANIEPIVTAISAKAGFYHAHTALVVQTGERLAQALGLSREDREQLRLAALLHDVGMLAVPDAVLNKTNPLSEEEWVQLRAHPLTAARWLEQVPALAHLAPIVRHHHERYDGTGYPDGLAGEAIPYLARVLAVADAYAALVADWPGRQGTPHEQAKAELEAGAGKQFDPKIAGTLLKVLAEEATNN